MKAMSKEKQLKPTVPQLSGETRTMANETKGADVLLEAHNLITGDRHNAYAHPLEDYTQTRDIFEALCGVSLTVEQAILFMVSVKLSRLRTALDAGRWAHDTVVDTAGYIGCLSMVYDKKGNVTDGTKGRA
jgi:Domain of unknown function (DUF6378)